MTPCHTPDSKVHGVNMPWGPSGADRAQVGPMLGPWTLLSGTTCCYNITTENRWKFCVALNQILIKVITLKFWHDKCVPLWHVQTFFDSKVHGSNREPIWDRRDPDGPHAGPIDFAVLVCSDVLIYNRIITIQTVHRIWIMIKIILNMMVPLIHESRIIAIYHLYPQW